MRYRRSVLIAVLASVLIAPSLFARVILDRINRIAASTCLTALSAVHPRTKW